MIRGENVVLLGEVDESADELPPNFQRVSEDEIKKCQKAEKEDKQLLRNIKAGLNDFLDLE